MSKIAEEKLLIEGNNGAFELTTHKVRILSKNGRNLGVTSIMLEHVSSCVIVKRTTTMLLIIAGLLGIAGAWLGTETNNGGIIVGGIGAAAFFIFIYFSTCYQVLTISSSSAKIRVNLNRISTEASIGLIDSIEEAKNQRSLQLATVGRTAPSVTATGT